MRVTWCILLSSDRWTGANQSSLIGFTYSDDSLSNCLMHIFSFLVRWIVSSPRCICFLIAYVFVERSCVVTTSVVCFASCSPRPRLAIILCVNRDIICMIIGFAEAPAVAIPKKGSQERPQMSMICKAELHTQRFFFLVIPHTAPLFQEKKKTTKANTRVGKIININPTSCCNVAQKNN